MSRLLPIVLLAAAGTSVASADIVLTVDTTDPHAIIIASTGAAASVSDSHLNYLVRLDSAVGAGAPAGSNFVGGLTTTLGSTTYGPTSRWNSTSLLLSHLSPQTQTFVAGTQAFSGSMTGDLWFLPFSPLGTIGDIYVLDSSGGETGVIIGQYQIVPTPGAAVLAGLGGLAAMRRRR